MTYSEYLKRVNELIRLSRAYYQGKPQISDAEYDLLYNELENYEKMNPDKVHPNSPTQHVGSPIKRNPVEHLFRMYSLDKFHNPDDLSKWTSGKIDKTFTVTPKYDGMSLAITYVNGVLKTIATRGDGIVGEDITRNVDLIGNIPLEINDKRTIQITGEVVVTKKVYESINQVSEEQYSNPRIVPTSIALSMELKFDKDKVLSLAETDKLLEFIPYNYQIENFVPDNDSSFFYHIIGLEKLGFKIGTMYHCDEVQAVNASNSIIDNRDKLQYQIDGAVVMMDNMSTQLALGYTNKFPRYGVALKPKPKGMFTRLIDIEHQIGTMGILTPVGILDPIKIDGVEIKKVTLNNYDYILEKDLRLGSKVEIIRSGDVIPKIISVDNEYVPDTYLVPNKCLCGSDLVKLGKRLACSKSPLNYVEVYWKNDRTEEEEKLLKYFHTGVRDEFICFRTALKRLEFALCSDGSLKPKGINVSTIHELLYADIDDLAKLYSISESEFMDKFKQDDYAKRHGITDKWLNNVWKSIDDSRICNRSQLIVSLCIPNVGVSAAKTLDKLIGKLSQLNETELKDIEKVLGVNVRRSVEAFWNIEGDSFHNIRSFREDLEVLENNLKFK